MAKRTYNNVPISVNTAGIAESYFNFATYKGFCDNKNYVSIDQNTFVEAKNVYVDNNNQLSSRPKLAAINVLSSDYTLQDIVKVGSRTFYIATQDGTAYLIFSSDNTDNLDVIIDIQQYSGNSKIKIAEIKNMYVIFNNGYIVGLYYDYDTEQWMTASADKILYKPITKIYNDGTVTDYESPNYLTNDVVERYLFTTGTESYFKLYGKTVELTIDNEHFTIIFTELTPVVITPTTGILNIIPSKIIRSDLDTYLAIVASTTIDKLSKLYYSVDAKLFTEIVLPIDILKQMQASPNVVASLSKSGDTLVIYAGYIDQNVTSLPEVETLYIAKINTESITQSLIFTAIDVGKSLNDSALYHCNAGVRSGSTYYMYSTNYKTYYRDSSFIAAVNAYDSSWIVLIRPCVLTYDTMSVTSDDPKMGYQTPSAGLGGSSNAILNQQMNAFNVVSITSNADTGYDVECQLITDIRNIDDIAFNEQLDIRLSMLLNYRVIQFIIYGTNQTKHSTVHMFFLDSNHKLCYRYAIDQTYLRCQKVAGSSYISNDGTYFLDVYIKSQQSDDIQLSEFSATFDTSNNSQTVSFVSEGASIGGTIASKSATMSDYTDTKDYTTADDYPLESFDPAGEVSGDVREYSPAFYDKSDPFVSLTSKTPGYKISPTNANKFANLANIYDNFTAFGLGVYFSKDEDITILDRSDKYGQNAPRVLYCTDATIGYYYAEFSDGSWSGDVYETSVTENTYLDVVIVSDEPTEKFIPEFVSKLVNTIFAENNKLYISSDTSSDTEILYLPTDDIIEIADDITNLVTFSTTALGVFLQNEVYELQYTTTNNLPAYVLQKTKLQLGCTKGSDVLLTYDGTSVLTTNLKGLSALSYEDFVQTTDQIYKYLTENIISSYEEFAKIAFDNNVAGDAGIKLCQYKNWIFMYSEKSKLFYLYDLRSQSWWQWESNHKVSELININDELYLRESSNLYKFVESELKYYDNDTEEIDWRIKSQKLHFNYPNNYKNVKSLTILANDDADEDNTAIVCKLRFYNYRNAMYETSDVVEYEVNQLTTFIKKVNFMKTNAFQFEISNDRNISPIQFKTPNIAIKYRVTEKVR